MSSINILPSHPPLVNKKEQFEEKVYIIITLNTTFDTIKTPNKKNFAELSAPFTYFLTPLPPQHPSPGILPHLPTVPHSPKVLVT